MRIRWSSESNRNAASALHSSVLPTPVGPRNRKLPYGRFGSDRPERERRIASDTRRTASSWPTTRSCSRSSILISFSRSPCIIFDTGMPVARDTTSAISSAPTWVRSSLLLLLDRLLAFLSCASSCGILPYWISDIFCQSPLRLASSICSLQLLQLFLDVLAALHLRLLGLPDLPRGRRTPSPACLISSSIREKRFCEASSFSFLHRLALDPAAGSGAARAGPSTRAWSRSPS